MSQHPERIGAALVALSVAIPTLLRALVLRNPSIVLWALGVGAPIVAGAVYSIGLEAVVPLTCRVEGPSVRAIGDGEVDLGAITETCNNPRGYEVWADTDRDLGSATFYIDGAAIPISADGHTRIGDSDVPAKRSRMLKLDAAGHRLDTLSSRIVSR